MALPPILSSIITWLRAGYPEGVPSVDYIPLFALLGSELTDAEVTQIADELASSSDSSSAGALRDAINAVTSQPPSDADVARVRSRLAEGGWPLAKPSLLHHLS
jgi:hypothetical protein